MEKKTHTPSMKKGRNHPIHFNNGSGIYFQQTIEDASVKDIKVVVDSAKRIDYNNGVVNDD